MDSVTAEINDGRVFGSPSAFAHRVTVSPWTSRFGPFLLDDFVLILGVTAWRGLSLPPAMDSHECPCNST